MTTLWSRIASDSPCREQGQGGLHRSASAATWGITGPTPPPPGAARVPTRLRLGIRVGVEQIHGGAPAHHHEHLLELAVVDGGLERGRLQQARSGIRHLRHLADAQPLRVHTAEAGRDDQVAHLDVAAPGHELEPQVVGTAAPAHHAASAAALDGAVDSALPVQQQHGLGGPPGCATVTRPTRPWTVDHRHAGQHAVALAPVEHDGAEPGRDVAAHQLRRQHRDLEVVPHLGDALQAPTGHQGLAQLEIVFFELRDLLAQLLVLARARPARPRSCPRHCGSRRRGRPAPSAPAPPRRARRWRPTAVGAPTVHERAAVRDHADQRDGDQHHHQQAHPYEPQGIHRALIQLRSSCRGGVKASGPVGQDRTRIPGSVSARLA